MRWLNVVLASVVACSGAPEEEALPTEGGSSATSTETTPSTRPGDVTSWTDGFDTLTVTVEDTETLERTYTLHSTHPQRDGGPDTVVVTEGPDDPVLRSGSLVFDALFALAIHEARLASVSEISDGAFDNGAPQACACFETGELWTYVWTRDTAYAVDLGLAWLDPERARASLEFKLSADKPAVGSGPVQIVQDTGTGGSWPVSTDRVVWALGARRTLATLPEAEREAFAGTVYDALVQTAGVDRQHVYDAADGLYRGESSFLDWREQTYPSWTATEAVHIAESKSLSTNVGHWVLLDLAAELAAERGDPLEDQWRSWADALATAIEAELWDEAAGAYARVKGHPFDPAPLDHRDGLGTWLAARHLASPERGHTALSTYPHGPWGAPVIWPQQPLVPIYHNRAIWPFVTAYGLRAAAWADHPAAADRAVQSLVRGAALNLSNMENFEWFTQANWRDDGDFSGPTVNSRRQLWSVGGYVGAVLQLMGIEPTKDGIRVAPYLPEATRQSLQLGSELTLHRAPWRGKTLTWTVEVGGQGTGAWTLDSVAVDGVSAGDLLDDAQLSEGSEVRVVLQPNGSTSTLTEVNSESDFTAIFAPREPSITGVVQTAGGLELSLDSGGEANVLYDVWRDGVRVADSVAGPTWVDATGPDPSTASPCYSVTSVFSGSGHRSQHARPVCWWGASGERVQWVSAWELVANGGQWGSGTAPYWWDWGSPGDTVVVAGVRPRWTGRHRIQWVGANGSGAIETGITAGHKWLTVDDAAGTRLAEGPVVFPHSGSWMLWQDSSALDVDLDANTTYTLTLSDAPNMSRLDHFTGYTGGLGGGTEAWNGVDIQGVKLLPLDGVDATPTTGQLVPFDGVDDLGKHAVEALVPVGVTQEVWEAAAISADADYLYVSVVARAFEDDWVPAVLYIEADPTGPAVPSVGQAYSGLVPELPFTPTHAIWFRAVSDDGTGPFNGVRQGASPPVHVWRSQPGVTEWLATDRHTLSVRVPRSLLGDAGQLRYVLHLVQATPGAEWVGVIPPEHAPWAAGGGGFAEWVWPN